MLTDKQIFTIVIFTAFANDDFLTSVRHFWENPWIAGVIITVIIWLIILLVPSCILIKIINACGFGVKGIKKKTYASSYMSSYNGDVPKKSCLSKLQSIGAAGLGVPGNFCCIVIVITIYVIFGFLSVDLASVGFLLGTKLVDLLGRLQLNPTEKQYFERFIQIEESTLNDHNMMIFTLMPALLYNDLMLKCFIETFMTSSSFADSKLYRFNFKDYNLTEEETMNNTVYNSLIGKYERPRVKFILKGDYMIGYDLDLNNYPIKSFKWLREIWKLINVGNPSCKLEKVNFG
ncbi:20192_t:CDS:1 [Funneliformis geosporum]|uniref:14271_t:CDS:1 n=1 Tax=Funneliformis geosporum TaxID=1117311 RepID=A0A9W4SEB6_9GLOM|nr:20192_t:CDS:1 [Funneliformis geosporum]CAI2165203.1 14271_t:CDS:1 [Funneliformis geosporum]